MNGVETLSPLTALQASVNRDALAKCTFSALFDWALSRINIVLTESTSPAAAEGTEQPSIAILDLYGFETLAENSLEQLLINLANETLQQIFNERVLLGEQEIYRAAGR